MLIDQNTRASISHVYVYPSSVSLLLPSLNAFIPNELFDRSGILYGELARFVLRILVIRTNPEKFHPPPGLNGAPGAPTPQGSQNYSQDPKAAPKGARTVCGATVPPVTT
ncbi:hypothetical protein CRG98_024292 [Punica granatum]|uniref:Uncharacterized protein n=1 Tax=Punica granatum TaxID=22663 RepID=A0A2I0JI46_PUNGR|nr:hypothetical protein CRG98_024292 [Punica granatum]